MGLSSPAYPPALRGRALKRPRPPAGSLARWVHQVEAAVSVRVAAASTVELGPSFTRDFCCRLGSAVTSQRAGPAAAMVAKDYPFYLTVKRANCSLEAPLGSGAAKDEVGRAPPGSSVALPWVPLAFFLSPLRAAFLQIATARLFSGSPLPALGNCSSSPLPPQRSQNPRLSLEPAKTPTYPCPVGKAQVSAKSQSVKQCLPSPTGRGWESLKFLEIGSDDGADTLGVAAV